MPALYMDVQTTQSTPSAQSADVFFRLVAWVHANRKRVIIGAIVVAVIALAWGLVSWKKAADEASANAQLFAVPTPVGMAARSAPVSPGPLLDLARQYPNTPAGEYAELFGAETLFTEGRYPEAQEQFSKFLSDHPDSALIAQARMGVAASVEAQGRNSEAIQKYQELISAFPSDLNIVTPAKLTLARLFEEENKPQQALTFYSELARIQNPYDPWAAEARERGQLLVAKHPELRKAEAAPAPAPFSLSQPTVKVPLPPAASASKGPAPAQPKPNPATPNSGINLLTIPPVSSNSAPR